MKVAVFLLLVGLCVELNGDQNLNNDDLDNRCPNIGVDLSRKHINASSTCGDNNSSNQYCYVDTTIQCSTCESKEEFDIVNAVDNDTHSHWISRPGLRVVNITVDLLQVYNVEYNVQILILITAIAI